jgi:hypothetical protein
VSRLSRIVLVLMLAALPLRGMAAVVAAFCGPQHEAPAQVQAGHECCETGEHDAGDAAKSTCSHCAACSVGAPMAPDQFAGVALPATGEGVIPFQLLRVPGALPDRLDRPPLHS